MKTATCYTTRASNRRDTMTRSYLHLVDADFEIAFLWPTNIFFHFMQLLKHTVHYLGFVFQQVGRKFLVQPCLQNTQLLRSTTSLPQASQGATALCFDGSCLSRVQVQRCQIPSLMRWHSLLVVVCLKLAVVSGPNFDSYYLGLRLTGWDFYPWVRKEVYTVVRHCCWFAQGWVWSALPWGAGCQDPWSHLWNSASEKPGTNVIKWVNLNLTWDGNPEPLSICWSTLDI